MIDVQKIVFDTLKAGAPGLSDRTREVLAEIIARKAALSTTPARAEALSALIARAKAWPCDPYDKAIIDELVAELLLCNGDVR